MLAHHTAAANIAVKSVAAARSFYEGVLGLSPISAHDDDFATYQCGPALVLVYRSEFAGTNRATVLSWTVGDQVAVLAKALAAKGVHFEHYDLPGLTLNGDVHEGDGMEIAWFKDPDGNILCLVSG